MICIAVIETASALIHAHLSNKKGGEINLTEFVLSKPAPFKAAPDYDLVRAHWADETDCPRSRIIFDPEINFPRFEHREMDCNGPENITDGLRKLGFNLFG